MSGINVDEVRKNLTRSYSIALFLIAVLSTLAFAGLISALQDSDNSSYLVNLSGKQRTLTQVIVLDIYRINELKGGSHDTALHSEKQNLEIIQKRLSRHISEMALANQQLSEGEFISLGSMPLSPELEDIYFGTTNLADEVSHFLQKANSLTLANADDSNGEMLHYLSEMALTLARDLDKAVLIYQQEGEEKLARLKWAGSVVWAFTGLVLFFVALLIFQPLVRRLVDLSTQHNENREVLKRQIEVRTLKLESANRKLKDLAYHDALTGLENRLNLERDIERVIEKHHRYHVPFAVLMIDIDWFKTVNDQHGHDLGDFVLKEFAQLLLDSVRVNDVVYRAGGEEFVLLLDSISMDEAQQKAEEIRKKVEMHTFELNEVTIKKTVSIGVYHSDLRLDGGVKFILKTVDDALYHSKVIGRNRVSLCKVSELLDFEQTENSNSHCVIIKFNQASFSSLKSGEWLSKQAECIKPFEVTDNINGLMGVEANKLIEGEHCIREFLHTDDFDVVSEFAKLGQNIEELSRLHDEKNQLWSSTFRVLNLVGDVKICSLEMYFVPGSLDGLAPYIELQLAESHQLNVAFNDAQMVYNFHAMLENTNDFIFFKDKYHVFTAASKTLVNVSSVNDRSEFVGKVDYDVFPKEYADKYFKLEKQVFSGMIDVAQEFQPTSFSDGIREWVDNRKYPIKDQEGNIIGLFGIARLVTDKEQKAKLDQEYDAQALKN